MVEQRLRLFYLSLAGFIFLGAMVELWVTEHWADVVQFLPFVLCGLGFVAVVAVLRRPKRETIRGLRVVMGILIIGGIFGIYEHIEHNLAFALEIQPNATWGDVFIESLGGANPLLAPGIVALGAIIALAATYRHPCMVAPPES